MKRIITSMLAIAMILTTAVGCGTTESTSSTGTSTSDTQTTPADPSKPYAGTVLKFATTDTAAAGDENLALIAMVKEKTGIEIDFEIYPNTSATEVDKQLVSLQGGDAVDLIYGTTPELKVYYNAGVLTPINELATAANYDMETIFGENLPTYDDGLTYGLPAFNDIWVTFYNKKVFDDAGVPHPTAEDWTWEKYVETATKLTNKDKNIFGSLMLDYDMYNYMNAIQNGATHYKEDGTVNYDDPRFKESVEFFYSLGNDLKIQPDLLSYSAGVYPWNAFVSTGVADEAGVYANPQFGMFVCGGWVASMLTNTDKYPRDWECGIAPMPYPEGTDPSTFAVTGNYAIPSTSENKEAAFEALKCIAENQYTLGYGRVPAQKNITPEESLAYINSVMVPIYAETDNISAEMIQAAWFDPNRTVHSEKIVGAADTVISQIWVAETSLFGLGERGIDETMAELIKRSNNAIEEEKAYD